MSAKKTFTYHVVYRCGHVYTVETFGRVSKAEQQHDQQVAARTLCPRCEEGEEKNVR